MGGMVRCSIVFAMEYKVDIIGGGLAGSEAALQLADRGIAVRLIEMRPFKTTDVHRTALNAELVCSNSLKGKKPQSAAGMLKHELDVLGSRLMAIAQDTSVPAGGALAVDRESFARAVTAAIDSCQAIERVCAEVTEIRSDGSLVCLSDGGEFVLPAADALVIAAGPLCSESLCHSLERITGTRHLSFFDAAAPIVYAEGIDRKIVFSQSRYEADEGDYLNAPFNKEEYGRFISGLVSAKRVVMRDFETSDLFQACQPIEEIARKGIDAPRFGTMKPVGLINPADGRRPWAVVQLRAEDRNAQSFNLVGFQTNLTFPEQRRVFRMIPGLEHAEFARYGVMHRNAFLDAPHLLDPSLRLKGDAASRVGAPVFVCGQLSGTEGYCEAIRGGLHVAINCASVLKTGQSAPRMPVQTAFGSLLAHSCDPQTVPYQPMHVNFGVFLPLDPPIKNKSARYDAYALRGSQALDGYVAALRENDLLGSASSERSSDE